MRMSNKKFFSLLSLFLFSLSFLFFQIDFSLSPLFQEQETKRKRERSTKQGRIKQGGKRKKRGEKCEMVSVDKEKGRRGGMKVETVAEKRKWKKEKRSE